MDGKEEKLLIIGAGAHVPYGFPTSQELTRFIKDIYESNDPFSLEEANIITESTYTELKRQIAYFIVKNDLIKDFDVVKFNAFLKSFCSSGVYSIDAYLSKLDHSKSNEQKTEEYSIIGRALVAFLISHFENKTLFGCHDFDWIHYIINNYVLNDLDNFINNPPSFITFNYDRFLEKTILGHLTEIHKMNEIKALRTISDLPIIHVYGSLGDCKEWEVREKNDNFYLKALDLIQVIGEQRSADKLKETKDKMTNMIQKCKKKYFLGYGFEENNNKLLYDCGLRIDSQFCYSTNIKLGMVERRKIKKQFNEMPLNIKPASENEVDCLKLLRDQVPL